MGTKRAVPIQDKAKFFALIASGRNIKDACAETGVHVNTGSRWLKRAKELEANRKEANHRANTGAGNGGRQERAHMDFMDTIDLPSAIPHDKLCEEALRGLEDFDYFRRRYLGRVPSPWQVEAALTLVKLLESEDKEFVVLNVPPGGGKDLSLDTPLLTTNGWSTMGDIKVGEHVFSPDGKPVIVVAKSEVFTDHECYEVRCDDGSSVVAGKDHEWLVRLHGHGQYGDWEKKPFYKGKTGSKPSIDGRQIHTTEFLAKKRSKRPQLQLAQPIELPEVNLPIDPYILGVWLGDGHSDSGRISSHQNDQPHMRAQFELAGYTTTTQKSPQAFGVLGLQKHLRQLGVLNNKHVPTEYLHASSPQRLSLLQGLIDTDGHVTPKGQVEFCNTNHQLARSVQYLAHSLGVKASISESRAMLYGKDCGPKWRVNFYLQDAARIPRKAERTRNGVRKPSRYLTVTPVDCVPTQCIQVEGGLFLAGNGLMVTHNSTMFHDVAVWAIVRNRRIRVMIGSVSQNMAKMYSRRIRETLERVSPIMADPGMVQKGLAIDAEGCLTIDYGRFKPVDKGALWRAEEFVVEQLDGNGLDNKEPTVRAYGIEAEFIGHRADLCLFDDVASPDNARESVARDKLLERWDGVAEARCDPGGVLVVVGQRLGSGDLYAHCLAKETYDIDEDIQYDGSDVETPEDVQAGQPVKQLKYRHIIYKAYYEELDTGKESRSFKSLPYPDGPLLDPKRIPWKDLSFIRYNKPDVFKVVYQQEDLDLESKLVHRTWITGGIGPDGVDYPGCIDGDRQPGYIPEGLAHPWVSIVAVDPSPTMFWAFVWIIYQPQTNLYHVVDIERVKLSAEEVLGYDTMTGQYSGLMHQWQERSYQMGYPISHWVVEINAAQRFLLAHDFVRKWQALHRVNVIPHTTTRNKLDESLGVEALLPAVIRSGALRLPSMKGNWKTLAATDELTKWSRDKKNGTDIVMALWMAILNLPNLTKGKPPPRQWRPKWL